MDYSYGDLHSWSKHYREEALAEASRRYLVERARMYRKQRSGWGRVGIAWASVPSLHRGVGL
jgi:hypothetical protein